MRSVLDEHDGSARPLYEMVAYHLGLDQTEGPRGKRLRPLLGLLAFKSLGGEYRKALPAAAAVELGHNFSLVHDDIEDSDASGGTGPPCGPSGACRWPSTPVTRYSRCRGWRCIALMKGEEYEPPKLLDVMRVYDETCLALCEGQYLDISFERRTDVTVEEYLEMIGQEDGRADRRLDLDGRHDGRRRPRRPRRHSAARTRPRHGLPDGR